MGAICFGGVASPILDTAGYDPRKTARKFWQPTRAPKRNQYRLECSRDLPAEVPWNARKKFWWHLSNLNLLELWLDALPARLSVNNICEQDLCPVSTVKCTLYGSPFPISDNTRPSPVRRRKIPASSYSPAREGGIQGLSFVPCFHMLCVPFTVLTNVCEQDLCPLCWLRLFAPCALV